MNEISEFYNQTDLRYAEIAICLEDTAGPTGKFSIPILTPLMDNDYIYEDVEYNRNRNHRKKIKKMTKSVKNN